MDFKPHSYSKQELAMLYFPDADPHVAVNRLNRWIRNCPDLRVRIASFKVSKYSKFFTSDQVRLIVDYLGDPWSENWRIEKLKNWIICEIIRWVEL